MKKLSLNTAPSIHVKVPKEIRDQLKSIVDKHNSLSDLKISLSDVVRLFLIRGMKEFIAGKLPTVSIEPSEELRVLYSESDKPDGV